MISVLIPAYNAGKSIAVCLNSLVSQCYSDYEIIIVDDGSKDDTRAICDFFAEEHSQIKVISQSNQGSVSARKKALENACGEYVAYVDSDDWISENCLSLMADVIVQYNPDVIYANYFETDGVVRKAVSSSIPEGFYDEEQKEKWFYPKLIEDEFGHRVSQTLWAKCFRKSLIKPIMNQNDNGIKMGDDIVVTVPCLHAAKSIYVLNDCVYTYVTNNPSSIVNTRVLSLDDPLYQADLLQRQINIDKPDFRMQLNRLIVRSVFLAASSQFNGNESVRLIAKSIDDYLRIPIIKNALKECRYNVKYFKGRCMVFVLRFRIYGILVLYSKRQRHHF